MAVVSSAHAPHATLARHAPNSMQAQRLQGLGNVNRTASGQKQPAYETYSKEMEEIQSLYVAKMLHLSRIPSMSQAAKRAQALHLVDEAATLLKVINDFFAKNAWSDPAMPELYMPVHAPYKVIELKDRLFG